MENRFQPRQKHLKRKHLSKETRWKNRPASSEHEHNALNRHTIDQLHDPAYRHRTKKSKYSSIVLHSHQRDHRKHSSTEGPRNHRKDPHTRKIYPQSAQHLKYQARSRFCDNDHMTAENELSDRPAKGDSELRNSKLRSTQPLPHSRYGSAPEVPRTRELSERPKEKISAPIPGKNRQRPTRWGRVDTKATQREPLPLPARNDNVANRCLLESSSILDNGMVDKLAKDALVVQCRFTPQECYAAQSTDVTEASTVTMASSTVQESVAANSSPTPIIPPSAVIVTKTKKGEDDVKLDAGETVESNRKPRPLLKRIPKKKSKVVVPTESQDCRTALRNEVKSCYQEMRSDPLRSETQTSSEENGVEQKNTASRDCKDTSLVSVGTRVSVFWDGEDKYYKGTVIKRVQGKCKPFYLKYDDGSKEWISFKNERFRLLSSSIKKKKKRRSPASTASFSACMNASFINGGEPYLKHTSGSSDGAKKTLETKKSFRELIPQSCDVSFLSTARSKVSHTQELYGEPKTEKNLIPSNVSVLKSHTTYNRKDLDWVSAGLVRDSSDSDTDEDEVMQFAAKMFGLYLPETRRKKVESHEVGACLCLGDVCTCENEVYTSYDVPMSISEKVKLARRNRAVSITYTSAEPKRKVKKKKSQAHSKNSVLVAPAKRKSQAIAEAERKEQCRALTSEEINAIQLADSTPYDGESWVRRSVRQPSKSALNAPRIKALREKLLFNDSDMVVLKMKKYCSDLDTPTLVIDAVLDTLEENTNCEALYIQNYNEGMRDEQVLHLLRVLARPSCNIWCLNIGETYNVQMETWEKFTAGLKKTKITHMYASEHTITADLKDQIREVIRLNRQKHKMHCDPNNLDTIIQCTHCWWNPINCKALRPFIRSRGYEHILTDAETQGVKGTMSGATLS